MRRRSVVTAAIALPLGATAALVGLRNRTPPARIPPTEELAAGHVTRKGTGLYLAGVPWRPVGVNLPWSLGWGDGKTPSPDQHEALFSALLPGSILRLWAFGNWTPERIGALVDQGRHHGHKFVLTLADFHGADSGERWVAAAGGGDQFLDSQWRNRGGWVDRHVQPLLERFSDDPAICMWEPINEPRLQNRKLTEFLNEITEVIRSRDAIHLIASGTASHYGDLNGMEQVNASRIDVASMHEYDETATPSSWTSGDVRLAERAGKPLLIGESGISTRKAGSPEARARLITAKIDEAAKFEATCAYLYWSAAAPQSYGVGDFEIDCTQGPELKALRRRMS